MSDCIFCKIIKGEIPCVKVYEDERVLAFADINPITDGHTLVIPKAHAENIFEIPSEDLMAVASASKKIATAIMEALSAKGVAVLQLNGRAVNQVVMHYHMHLVPRSGDEPALPISGWEMKPGDMERVKAVGEMISSALEG